MSRVRDRQPSSRGVDLVSLSIYSPFERRPPPTPVPSVPACVEVAPPAWDVPVYRRAA